MSFRFDLYVDRRGWAHRVDPRVKLLFVVLGAVTMILFSNLFFMLASLLVIHLLIASTGVPRDRFIWVWKAMLPINFLIPPLWTVFYPEGQVLFELWVIEFTPLALVRGLAVAARLDAIAFICFLWLFTTDQRSIVRSLVKIGMPFEWGLVLALSLRYLPTFYGLYNVVSEAQQARALDLSKGNFLQKLKSYMPILVAMLISALRTADKLGKALESRALGVEGVQRTSLHDIAFSRSDYVIAAGLVVAFFGAVALRVLGVFAHPLYLSGAS
jgi:energy-coupling factor transport system permease protein